MATIEYPRTPGPGRWFIHRRPSVHHLVASWMSPPEQRVTVKFEVMDLRTETPAGWKLFEKQIFINRLVRDEALRVIWFGGQDPDPTGPARGIAGFIDLRNNEWQGLLLEDIPGARPELEMGSLPAIRIRRAIASGSEIARLQVGDRGLGTEIAHAVINQLSWGTNRIGAVCPKCFTSTTEDGDGRERCHKHGPLQSGAARVVAFAPCTSELPAAA